MPSGSPRFGEPGFVVPIDERTVSWPEMRGNGVMTSLGNLVKNPKAHLIFPDLSERIGLHLRGETTIVEHDVMCLEHPAIVASVKTPRPPERWVILKLEVGYVHCRKHFPRCDDKPVDWGTDDVKAKGGSYFGAKLPKPGDIRRRFLGSNLVFGQVIGRSAMRAAATATAPVARISSSMRAMRYRNEVVTPAKNSAVASRIVVPT